jgi:hypothetical protein
MNVGTYNTCNRILIRYIIIVPELSTKKNRIPMPGKEISNETGDSDRHN